MTVVPAPGKQIAVLMKPGHCQGHESVDQSLGLSGQTNNASRRPRILFSTNYITHYRKTFFAKLCALSRFEWLIVHGGSTGDEGRPAYAGELALPQATVINHQWTIGPYKVRWQAGQLREGRRFNPDLVIVLGIVGTLSNWLLLLWARRRRIPVLIWAAGWEPQRPGSLAWKFKRLVARWYYAAANHCLLYSTKGARYVEELGVSKQRITVCYNGIEIAPLVEREPDIRAAGEIIRTRAGGDRILLYVGGMLLEKRVDLLIRAFRRIQESWPNVQLWLIGDGPARGYFEHVARDSGARNVQFFGRIVEDVDCYFAAADFFVLPGLGGLAFNQAMFWGVPCIGSEADGTEDDLVIDGLTGKRFARDDERSLADAMSACLSLPDTQLEKWRLACRDIIFKQSNVDAMIRAFERCIDRVLGHEFGRDPP